MSDKKTMVEWLDSRIDALTAQVDTGKRVAEELRRRIYLLELRVNTLSDPASTPTAPEPEGVYVRPGMQCRAFGEMVTIAPKGYHAKREWTRRIHAWSGAFGISRAFMPDELTYKGQPVLGYEEDRP